jgi:hypothetical protein
MPVSRSAPSEVSSTPRSPFAPISTAEQVRPAAPMSWMAMTQPFPMISRQASSSSFSANGSPTCTVGRFSSAYRRRIRPRPWSRRGCRRGRSSSRDRRSACRRRWPLRRRSCRRGEADRHRVDEDVAVIARVETDLAADRRHAEGIAVAADAGDDAGDEVPGLRMLRAPKRSALSRRSAARPW